jgi:hypothetical protein
VKVAVAAWRPVEERRSTAMAITLVAVAVWRWREEMREKN